MDRLTSFFTGLDRFRFSSGGNFVDRINYKYTTMVIGFFGVALMAIQFIGNYSIHCFCPAHFTDAMVEYTNRRCWTTNTYRVPMSSVDIPESADKGREYISYYQWVIPIMFVQCLMLYIPSQLWRFFTNLSGFQISNIIIKAAKYNKTIKKEKKEEVLVDITDRFLARKRIKTCLPSKVNNTIDDYWLCVTYLIVKLFYVLDVVWLMQFTDRVLGGTTLSHSFVIDILREVFVKGDWPESPYFPVVTLCDFPMRTLNQIQHHTIQCTLPLNFYHERMFVVLWVWFAALFFLNLFSLIYWLVWMVIVLFVRRGCRRTSDTDNNNTFLGDDGGGTSLTKPLLGAYDAEIGGGISKRRMLAIYSNPNMIFIYEIIKSNVGTFTSKAFAEALVVRINRLRKASREENHTDSLDRKPSAPKLE